MPNWCENYVQLSGPKDRIEDIVAAATSGTEDAGFFDHALPLSEETGISDRYDRWGTKWDVTDADASDVEQLSDDIAEVELSFMTAWSPPIGVYEALSDNLVKVQAYYYEPGMAFCGVFEDEQDHEYPIDIDTGDFFEVDEHGMRLNELFGIRDDLKSINSEEYDHEW